MAFFLLLVAAGDWFARGNEAYEAGQFAQAVTLYDSAAAVPGRAEVYFNRGNAWFKQGKVGKAIADYLRAWALSPHDPDIRYNLEFSRRFRPDRNATRPNPLVDTATRMLRFLPAPFVAIGAGLMFLLAAAGMAVMSVSGRRAAGWLALGAGMLFVYCLAAQASWASATSPARVVVIVPELVLRAGPGAEYKEIVIVHDGMEATARERRPGWVLIQVPGGEGGWVEDGTVEQIFGG
uniref:Tetratricopeptide repeat protein n=1 Tax=candidate division WOR-3 bacterium TaxID=2052148 RepID=A0A7C4GFY3_UNCW3